MSDEQTKALRRSRGDVKRNLTRIIKFVDTHNKPGDEIAVQQRIHELEPLLDKFNDIQNQIETLIDFDNDDAVEREDSEREEFESKYYETLAMATNFVKPPVAQQERFQARSPPISQWGSFQTVQDVNQDNITQIPIQHTDRVTIPQNLTSQFSNSVRLPKIDLPTFDGAYEKWLAFRDMFNSLIHSNLTLPKVQKFHYLRSSLKGEAANIVQSLEVCDESYDAAWSLLEDRYDNKRLIINNHLKGITNITPLLKESSSGLRSLLDNLSKNLRALKVLKQPVEYWDTIIVFLVVQKLDPTTRREWEKEVSSRDYPSTSELEKFLRKRCELFETIEMSKQSSNLNRTSSVPISHNPKPSSRSLATTTKEDVCHLCSEFHRVYNCPQFRKMSVSERTNEVKRLKLCLNCFGSNHMATNCRGSGCRICNQRHSTLLHTNLKQTNATEQPVTTSSTDTVSTKSATTVNTHIFFANQVLLSTALVFVQGKNQNHYLCRVLLDSGSQSNFITESMCKKLGIKRDPVDISISGLNEVKSTVTSKAKLTIQSCVSGFSALIECLIVTKITNSLPEVSFSTSQLNIPKNVILADPEFNISSPIDMLIGAELFYELLSIGQIRIPEGPMLQKTVLGWVLSGKSDTVKQRRQTKSFLIYSDAERDINKFWEIEEIKGRKPWSQEETLCEKHFVENTERDKKSGKFIVKLPFNEKITSLFDTGKVAEKRFISLEKRLEKDLKLREKYQKFMREYEDLEHMQEIKTMTDETNNNGYYLPHHPVVNDKQDKIRVVFDGSAQTDCGLSLNDCQMVGPTIQNELLSIILRFRKYPYVLTADIEKMYRMVLMHPDFHRYQRIYWRNQSDEEMKTYELTTVTYGTSAAAFLAIRCLYQVALDLKSDDPELSKVIENDFYVDDLMTGAQSMEAAMELKDRLCKALNQVGFNLTKWRTNFDHVPEETETIMLGDNESKKLGILWNSRQDTINYEIVLGEPPRSTTKRVILSEVSKIFDPLGLLGPVVIKAKILMQKLWSLKLDWDESVPIEIYTEWIKIRQDLTALNSISIPRCVIAIARSSIELHGFSDASERAYGAVMYIRTRDPNQDNWSTKLLCAKSKVAPLHNLSLPRLELCGALILARLFDKVISSMDVNFDGHYLWCDSTIVLNWLNSPPSRWKTFIANRVSEIQNLTQNAKWQHVPSNDNPADLLSRGIYPSELSSCEMWFSASPWLQLDEEHWPDQPNIYLSNVPEQKTNTISLTNTDTSDDLFYKWSSISKTKRILSWVKRFIHNSKNKPEDRRNGPLSVEELEDSLRYLLKTAQSQFFHQEISTLSKGFSIPSNSSLKSLQPFLDSHGILRVGGRLVNAEIDYNQKHPIILPDRHQLTKMIFEDEHKQQMHCGAQALLNTLRQRYWPLRGRCLARQTVHKCVRCFRAKPPDSNYLMGSLPACRVTPAPPFFRTGVDYAGPIMIRNKRGRGSSLVKAYICVFVCLTTRAIHLEAVSDLTTQCFLQTLRRFVARRGKPRVIYSDNGSNFVGASSELQRLYNFIRSKSNFDVIQTSLANDSISWIFIPANSPNWGGLWEAGVKSVKFHLKRVLGNANLVFEDLCSVLCQIESILNSRPLSPLSNDPNDMTPLTPGHFLIGRPLTTIPSDNHLDTPMKRLNRFEYQEKICQDFWQRWHQEYLSYLQQRKKWTQSTRQIRPGDLVVIRDQNLPPMRWKMRRVEEVYPSPSDGVVRVASVRCAGKIVKRACNRLCVLPLDDE
ncbi:uncharacterized protein LOC107399201 [Tribolium castaneum]|uniref:uncharacterized protein LOC107399201 n=1 Tax=Tribolium castaneum TaxID=7070 RepID=UPI0030FEDFF2